MSIRAHRELVTVGRASITLTHEELAEELEAGVTLGRGQAHLLVLSVKL